MSGMDDTVASEGEQSGDWSVLYAPDAPLTPTVCPECGNVFATDSTSCPWCGRIVEPGESAPTTATVAALSNGPARPSTTRTSSGAIRARLAANGEAGIRRWAPLLIAGGILLVIAIGLLVRALHNDSGKGDASKTSPTTVAPSAAPTAATQTAASATTETATTETAATIAATIVPVPSASTSPSSVRATTSAPTAAPTTARSTAPSSPPSTLGNSGSAVPSATLTATEQQAAQVVQDFAQAIVGKNWTKVRQITVAPNATDQQYDTFYGKVRAINIIPARVESLTDGSYNVWAGVVSVDQSSGADVSSLYCARYNVNPVVKTIPKIATADVRTQPGVVDPASVTTELRGTCFSAKFA